MKHFGICLILWTMPLLSAGIPSSRLRIVLLGKSGAGKSATGNTILGKHVFKEDSTFDSVTSDSLKESGRVLRRQITVVDTPGLFHTYKTPGELKSEIEKCVNMSVPGPHIFLLVIRLGVRFTEEERNAVKWIQENFGKRAAEFTMVLFTHADQLKGKSVEHNFNKDLWNLIDSCGGGYHSFNNLDWDDLSQVEELLEKIDAIMEKHDGKHYRNKMYQDAQRRMREEKRKRQEEEEKRKEYERKIREDERKQAEEDFRKAEEETKKQHHHHFFAKKVGEGVEAVVGVVEDGIAIANNVVVAVVEGVAGLVLGRLMKVGGLEADLARLMKVRGMEADLGISKMEKFDSRLYAGWADGMDRYSSCCRCSDKIICCGQRRAG